MSCADLSRLKTGSGAGETAQTQRQRTSRKWILREKGARGDAGGVELIFNSGEVRYSHARNFCNIPVSFWAG